VNFEFINAYEPIFFLVQEDDSAPSPALLFQNHLDRWNLIRQRWKEASAYNERRYDSSFSILRQIHDRYNFECIRIMYFSYWLGLFEFNTLILILAWLILGWTFRYPLRSKFDNILLYAHIPHQINLNTLVTPQDCRHATMIPVSVWDKHSCSLLITYFFANCWVLTKQILK